MFARAVLPTSVRYVIDTLERLRKRKVTARSSCCWVRAWGLVGWPSSLRTLVRGQSE